MQVLKRRRVATTLVAAAGIAAAVVPASAMAVSNENACANSATANYSQITVDTSGTSPATAAPGSTVTLSNIQQSGFVPGTIFAAGYNLGVLQKGPNSIPTDFYSRLEGTNTVEGTQKTSVASSTLTTTISDPDGTPGTGDETATDATFAVSYANLDYTAGPSGVINFRQDSISPPVAGTEVGSFIAIGKLFGGAIKIRFACTPGTVAGSNPGTPTYLDPAPPFATTAIASAPPSSYNIAGSGTLQNANPNPFTINTVDQTGTVTYGAAGSKTYNGVVSCVNVVGNAATIVSQDTARHRLNRMMIQDNGATGDKVVNTMVTTNNPADVAATSSCIAPNLARLTASTSPTGPGVTITPVP